MRTCLALLCLSFAAVGCSDDDFGTADSKPAADLAVPADLGSTDEAVPADITPAADQSVTSDLSVFDATPIDAKGDLGDLGGG